jgi:RHS repeat-associated protein
MRRVVAALLVCGVFGGVQSSVAVGARLPEGTPLPAGASQAGLADFNTGPDAYGTWNVDRGPGEGAAPPVARALGATQRASASERATAAMSNDGPTLGDEIPSFRTEFSRTYSTVNGGYVARIFTAPVNYKAADGSLQPIDDTLRPAADGSFVNKADAYRASVPQSLGDAPVAYRSKDGSVTLKLEGAADAAAVVKGATATYREAFPGVSVKYRSMSTGLKEDVTFATRESVRSLVYAVAISKGLRPRLTKTGALRVVDAKGKVRFTIAAPYLQQAGKASPGRGKVAVKLTRTAAGWRMVLTPNAKWIAAKNRRFPVVLDPVITTGSTGDCTITNAAPTTPACAGGSAYDYVGGTGAGTYRSVFRFSTSAVPANAQVITASLGVYASGYATGTPMTIDAYQLGSDFNYQEVTWNSRKTGTAWGTAGGDLAGGQARSLLNTTGWNFFAIPALVQSWVDGSAANNGVLLKTPSEPDANLVAFTGKDFAGGAYAPYLQIQYTPRLGRPRGTSFDDTQLSDRMSMGVNLANGNLVIQNTDLSVSGTGLNQTIQRTYNSESGFFDEFGKGWSSSTGRHPRLINNGNALVYNDGDGGFYPYNVPPGTTDLVVPPGIDKTLCVSPVAPCSVPGTVPGGAVLISRDGTRQLFDAGGNQISVTDRNGNALSTTFGGLAVRPTLFTDTHGRTITPGYNASNEIISLTDNAYPGGRATSYTLTSDYLVGYTDAEGHATTYGYDASLNLVQITDPAGHITKFTYDAQGRIHTVLQVTNTGAGTGDTTTYDYLPPSTTITGTSPAIGCPNDPDGGSPYSQTVITNARGKKTTYCNDTHDRTYVVFDAYGHKRDSTYDKDDNVKEFTLQSGAKSTTTYDKCYRPMSGSSEPSSGVAGTGVSSSINYNTPYPAGPFNATDCAFTGVSNPYGPIGSTDPQGNTATVTYDAKLNPETQTNTGTGTSVVVHHNASNNGRVDYTRDGNGNDTIYGYTSGDLTQIQPPAFPAGPLIGNTNITNDAVSRPLTIQDGNGRTTTYTYDKSDRVKTALYADGTTTTYTYDNDGNLTQQADSNGTSTYTFDQKSRKLTEVSPGASNTYTYDSVNNLATATDAGGTVSFGYDDVNNLTSVTQPSTSPITFGYDTDDRRTCTTYPNGVVIQSRYDKAGALLSTKAARGSCNTGSSTGTPTGTQLSAFTYDLHNPLSSPATDRALRYTVTDLAGNKTTYTYDALNRLTAALTKDSSGTTTLDDRRYTLDGAGNITSRYINGTTTTLAYNQVNEISTAGFTYDPDGNLTAKPNPGGATFAYNQREQTTSITPSGGGAQSFSYLGPGQAMMTAANNGVYTNNLLGISSQGTGCILTLCTMSYYTRDVDGNLLAERLAGGTYYYLTDGLGSITGLTDPSGNIANTYKYDPYGQTTASSGAINNPFGYAQGLNTTAGHIKFGERLYDPGVGRWTQQDPLMQPGDPGQANRYAYVSSDPTNATDSEGLTAPGPNPTCNRGLDTPGESKLPKCKGNGRSIFSKILGSNMFKKYVCVAAAGGGGALIGTTVTSETGPGVIIGAGAGFAVASQACSDLFS